MRMSLNHRVLFNQQVEQYKFRFLCSKKKHLFSCHVTNLIRPSVHAHKMCLITLILTKRKQNHRFAVLHPSSCSFSTTKLYFPFRLHPTCCNLLNMSACTKFMNGCECVCMSFLCRELALSRSLFPSLSVLLRVCVCASLEVLGSVVATSHSNLLKTQSCVSSLQLNGTETVTHNCIAQL